MTEVFEAALDDFDFYRQRYALIKRLSEKAEQVYRCFKEFPERRLSRKDIMQMIPLPQRTLSNHLKNLLSKNLIHSTGEGSAVRYGLNF